MQVSGDLSAILEPGLRMIYGLTYNQFERQFTNVFDVKESKMHNEEDRSMTGFGYAQVKDEGGGISFDLMYQGFQKIYTHVEYSLGFQVSRILVEDDLYNIINQLPAALARSNWQTLELLTANILNNAFTGNDQNDGKDLCDTARPLEGPGATWQNKPTVSADFDLTSLEQAIIDIGDYVDGRGLKMKAMPKKLIVPLSEAWQADVVLNTAQRPGTQLNDKNPASSGLFPGGVQVMNWLTDPDAWFIQTDVPNGLTFFWRRHMEFGRDNDFNTQNAKFASTFRCSQGSTDPRGIYGNPGA